MHQQKIGNESNHDMHPDETNLFPIPELGHRQAEASQHLAEQATRQRTVLDHRNLSVCWVHTKFFVIDIAVTISIEHILLLVLFTGAALASRSTQTFPHGGSGGFRGRWWLNRRSGENKLGLRWSWSGQMFAGAVRDCRHRAGALAVKGKRNVEEKRRSMFIGVEPDFPVKADLDQFLAQREAETWASLLLMLRKLKMKTQDKYKGRVK